MFDRKTTRTMARAEARYLEPEAERLDGCPMPAGFGCCHCRLHCHCNNFDEQADREYDRYLEQQTEEKT